VLTGTRIGTYSSDNLDLSGLVHRILKETDIRRLHLSSLQPDEISDRLLNLWPENRLCCHFHLALQSGSGSVLKRMNRGYTLDDYKKAVDSIRNVLPDASITTDIVVGFPGETEIEFEESYRYCSSMEFAAIHVFPYSARPGTAAAEMVGHMTAQVKKARSLKMLALSRRCSREYRGKFLGKELTVLWEGEDEPGSGIYSGLTENYIRLFRHSSEHLSGIFQSVKPVQLDRNGLWA
jgi:threonylcarbamoyladenosine tRNA methylthiotransferase MtaB